MEAILFFAVAYALPCLMGMGIVGYGFDQSDPKRGIPIVIAGFIVISFGLANMMYMAHRIVGR